jgi:hypothetical protein
MPHPVIYAGDLNTLLRENEGSFLGRDQECVALPQFLTNIGFTGRWQAGQRVADLNYLRPGSIIANFLFERGKARFPSRHRYHAALFLGFGERKPDGGYWRIWVIDQWTGHPLARRYKRAWTAEERKVRNPAPADDADQFYVVTVP